jgi:Bacterial Ig-like domain (group 1)
MKVRKWATWRSVQLAGVALLALMAATFAAINISGADVASGSSGPYAVPVAPFAAGTPFSSGQPINVVVPANSIFLSTSGINIVECAAPGGVDPTLPAECDGNTVQVGTVLPNADGSFTFIGYPIYALPDSISLGEGASNAVTCGITAATECVLYIGNDQTNFTAPHVFSQPFNVAANADDKGENPGDGSLPTPPTAPSASLSTAVASPSTAVADGGDTSTVTVTLEGTGNVPVPGKTVTLSQGTGKSTITPAEVPNVTDANGVATFTVTDTAIETVTYTATDTTDSVTLTAQPTVDFEAPAVSASNSSVMSSLASVPSGQSDTITVTVRDQGSNPQPVAGQSVTLSGTGSVQITPQPPTQVTTSSGVATFTATDSSNEVVTFTAVDATANNLTLIATPSVTFGSLVVSPSTSTVTAATPIAKVGTGGGTSMVVKLLTAGGSPVAGINVALAASTTTASADPSTMATDATGEATFTVSDSAAETVTFSATDTTDSPSIPITATAAVQFETPVPSAMTSKVLANGQSSTTSVADGETETAVSILLEDQFGEPLPGASVTLEVSGSAAEVPAPSGSTPPGTTNPAGSNNPGEADFQVDDEVAETVTLTAIDTSVTPNVTVANTATIAYSAGAPDPGAVTSTVTAAPTTPPSDGTTPTTITVTVTDEFGNAVSGQAITLNALPSGNTADLTAGNATTNGSGEATFSATDATAEVVTFQATDSTDSNTPLTSEAVVTFGTPAVPPPVATFCSVVATPTSVPADGSTSATISVLLYNGAGDAVPGKAVTLTASGGNSIVTAVNGTTTSTGNALFSVTDSTAESVTYTAEDTTDSLNLPLLPVTIQFTAANGTTTTTSTTTSTTSTTAPAGSSTSTTSTTAPSTTTTSSAPAVATAASDSSSDDGSDDSSGDGSGDSSLALTGVSPLLLWFAGLGAVMTGLGTVGRRRFKEAK